MLSMCTHSVYFSLFLPIVRPGVGGDGVGPDYGNWDGDHVTVCNCDWGFFGPDCSLRICAKDDDPTTSNQK